jgi:ABC-type iron transport system FetAB permease component
MSEASDNLTAAVQGVQTSFDSLNSTLQTEMQEIANALSGAGTDQALRDAATDAVTRLGNLATSISEMNTQVQGIIP